MVCRLINYCNSWKIQPKYSNLSKKDENFGIEQAKNWVKNHPANDIVEKKINYAGLQTIDKYAIEVIKNLKKIPITSSNVEIIKSHLVEMAKKSDLLGQALIKKVLKLKAKKVLITCIYDALAFTQSDDDTR